MVRLFLTPARYRAIVAYTMDNCKDRTSNIYFALNNALRNRKTDSASFLVWQGFLFYLMRALDQLPAFQGVRKWCAHVYVLVLTTVTRKKNTVQNGVFVVTTVVVPVDFFVRECTFLVLFVGQLTQPVIDTLFLFVLLSPTSYYSGSVPWR